jgi:hypothetical protein
MGENLAAGDLHDPYNTVWYHRVAGFATMRWFYDSEASFIWGYAVGS